MDDPETGLDTITAYQVFWDYGSNGAEWVLLLTESQGSLTFTHVVASGILRSSWYKFYYRAVNQHG